MAAVNLIAGRIGLAFVTLFLVSIVIFAMVEVLPGDSFPRSCRRPVARAAPTTCFR